MTKIYYEIWKNKEYITTSVTFSEVDSLVETLKTHGYKIKILNIEKISWIKSGIFPLFYCVNINSASV